MTSILFVTVRFYRNQFKCSYLRNKKVFPIFFAPFLQFSSNFENVEKKMTIIAYVFWKLRTA